MANEMATVDLTGGLNGTVSQRKDSPHMDSIAVKKSNGLTNGVASGSRDYNSSSTVQSKLRNISD